MTTPNPANNQPKIKILKVGGYRLFPDRIRYWSNGTNYLYIFYDTGYGITRLEVNNLTYDEASKKVEDAVNDLLLDDSDATTRQAEAQ